VGDGEIHWFIASSTGANGSSALAEVAAWVAETSTAQTIDGVRLSDLSGAAG